MQRTAEQIFEEEFLPFADALYNFALHRTSNDADADDLVQDTFLRAFKSIESYEQGTNAKAWLFKILSNSFINEYRKKTKQPQKVEYEEFALYHDNDDEDSDLRGYTDLREEVYDNLMGDEITLAMADLTPENREIILLSDVEDLPYDDIAKIMHIPIGTVRTKLFRARNKLKIRLKTYAESFGYEDKR